MSVNHFTTVKSSNNSNKPVKKFVQPVKPVEVEPIEASQQTSTVKKFIRIIPHGKLSSITIFGDVPKGFLTEKIHCYELRLVGVNPNIDLQNIQLDSCYQITIENSKFSPQQLDFIRNAYSLTHLSITGNDSNIWDYQFLSSLRFNNLISLKLEGLVNVSPNFIRNIGAKRLVEMEFSNCVFTSGSFPISDYLEHLRFYGCDVTSNMLVEIGNAKYLRTLIVESAPNLNDNFIHQMKCWKSITDFQLIRCGFVTRLSNLNFENLSNFVVDQCLALEELTNIQIERCGYFSVSRCKLVSKLANIKIGNSRYFQISSIDVLEEIKDINVGSNDGGVELLNLHRLRRLENLNFGTPSSLNLKFCNNLFEIDNFRVNKVNSSIFFHNLGIKSLSEFKGINRCPKILVTHCNSLGAINDITFYNNTVFKVKNCMVLLFVSNLNFEFHQENGLELESNKPFTKITDFEIYECPMLITIENLKFNDVQSFSISRCKQLRNLRKVVIESAENVILSDLPELSQIQYSLDEKIIINNFNFFTVQRCQALMLVMIGTQCTRSPVFKDCNDKCQVIMAIDHTLPTSSNFDNNSYASIVKNGPKPKKVKKPKKNNPQKQPNPVPAEKPKNPVPQKQSTNTVPAVRSKPIVYERVDWTTLVDDVDNE